MPKLAGKFALITGGNSGIGLATAKLFVAEGAKVAITGRNAETLSRAASELGKTAVAVRGDLTHAAHRDALFSAVKERLGALDLLFAHPGAAGLTPPGSTQKAGLRKQGQL